MADGNGPTAGQAPQSEPAKPAETSAADEQPAQVNGFNGRLPLRHEVANGSGGTMSEIVFREPTAADIERVGNPVMLEFLADGRWKPVFDTRVMTAMLATLAKVPPSTIRAMHPRDWQNAAYLLANFFLPDM